MTELDGSGHWMHTNVYANGRLLATYGANETFFSLQDWQGTKRVQTTSNGEVDLTYASLPYGDNLTVSGSGPNATDQFFTGKERDQESGNDYFGARYYSSLTGRFLSPDWSAKVEPVPYARLSDPQSMNLYTYVENSPMDREDTDGHVQNSGTENNWGSLAYYINNLGGLGGLIAWQIASVGSNPLDGLSNISIATQLALIQTLTQISSAFAQPAQAQQQKQFYIASVIFGETSGLRQEIGKNGKQITIVGSNPSLETARENIADVAMRNSNVYSRVPTSAELKNPHVRTIWRDCQVAASASDGSLPGNFFFLREAGVGPQRPSERQGWGQGKPIKEYGPFINVGGGDVPSGNQTYIDIYNH